MNKSVKNEAVQTTIESFIVPREYRYIIVAHKTGNEQNDTNLVLRMISEVKKCHHRATTLR